MTYGSLLNRGTLLLTEAGLPEARLDAELLLLYVSDQTRSFLFVHKNEECSEETAEQFLSLIEKRRNGEPVQYITGSQEFMGLEFEVNPSVLIPRQDTEILVEAAIHIGQKRFTDCSGNGTSAEAVLRTSNGLKILDMCCGSGAIAVSMAHYLPQSEVTACDISPEALKTASSNARRNGVSDRIQFLQGDLFTALRCGVESENGAAGSEPEAQDPKTSGSPARFDLILSNPPYIPTDVISTLQREITEHEPMTALDGGQDGLHFYRILAEQSQKYLKKGGHLLMEIGHDQAEDVCLFLKDQIGEDGECSYMELEVLQDLAGLDRVVHCIRR